MRRRAGRLFQGQDPRGGGSRITYVCICRAVWGLGGSWVLGRGEAELAAAEN